MTTSNILIVLLAAVVAGIPGYLLSFKFWASQYSRTNKSGDFGSPRGGVFAMASGLFTGLVVFRILGGLEVISPDAVGVGMISSMIIGMIAGIIGTVRGQKKGRSTPPTPPSN